MLYHSIYHAPDSSGFGDINLTLIYRSIIRSNNFNLVSRATHASLWRRSPAICDMVSIIRTPAITRANKGGQRGQPHRHTRRCPSVLKPVPRFLYIIMLYILFASVYGFHHGAVMIGIIYVIVDCDYGLRVSTFGDNFAPIVQ